MKVWISNLLIDSNISHDEFILINNMLKEYKDIISFSIFIKTMLSDCLKFRKNTESKHPETARRKNGRIMLL